MHRMLTHPLLGLSSLIFAADVANVRIEVNGVTYTGTLTAQSATPPTPAPRPIAVFTGQTPFAVHLDAPVDPRTLRDTRVTWDFGDPNAAFNVIDGYNAAHLYDKPGRYTITRTIDRAGEQTIDTFTVDVAASTRRPIFVSNDGDDRNDGASEAKPVKSVARVAQLVSHSTAVRFRRGDTFLVDRTLSLRFDDVTLGAFGDAGKPRPMLRTDANAGRYIVVIDAAGKGLVVEDLAFDAINAKPFEKAGTADVVAARGQGLTIRNCAFLNVNYAVNGNGEPDGVLLQNNLLPLETGLRAYFAWVQGKNWTILGNAAVNSTREHIVRCGGGTGLNIQFNDFANLDRRQAATDPDANDTGKAALNIQKGSVLYVANNVLRGPNGVGPLGGADGLNDKPARWIGAVWENNRVAGFIETNHGAEHVTLRNNFVRRDDNIAFPTGGFNNDFGRGVVDLRLERNTAVNAGTQGNFITVGWGAKDVSLVENLYVAPELAYGAYQSAAVYVHEDSLRAFREIRGNVWPVARPRPFAQNGVNYVGSQGGKAEGYRDAAEWNAMPPVDGDRVQNISLESADDDAHRIEAELNAGADRRRLPGAFNREGE